LGKIMYINFMGVLKTANILKKKKNPWVPLKKKKKKNNFFFIFFFLFLKFFFFFFFFFL